VYLSAMKSMFKSLAIFFILLVATSVAFDVFQLNFGTTDYWQNHGWWFLVFISFFPRLTLLFGSVASGGFLWWAAWVFCPRILVALLATVSYFHTNPVLVVISWFIALSGEVFEKRMGMKKNRNRFIFRTYHTGGAGPFKAPPEEAEIHHGQVQNKGDVIEAEFKKH
jgi:hypothetical protein